MRKTCLVLITFVIMRPLLAAVIVYVPPEPLLTLPDPSSDRKYDVDFDGNDDFFIGGSQAIGTSFGTIAGNRYLAIPAIPPNSGGQSAALAEGSILGPAALPALAWLSSDSTDGFVSPGEIGDKFTILTLCVNPSQVSPSQRPMFPNLLWSCVSASAGCSSRRDVPDREDERFSPAIPYAIAAALTWLQSLSRVLVQEGS